MTVSRSQLWLHRLAISTLCVAFVTLTFGALVTTKHAGMAFPDWPTSDGYLMVTYPWLKDFAVNWNKFLEHGHRLVAMLTGIWSIALVAATCGIENRRWVKGLSIAILLGVISQGLLGGFRVQLNDRGLAMLHGIFAAIVFSLMGSMAVVTSAGWRNAPAQALKQQSTFVNKFAVATLMILVVQYVFGSLIRHQGTGLHEHLGLGILSLLMVVINTFVSRKSASQWVRRAALALLLVAVGQVSLGLATWVVKFGLSQIGYVAVVDSIQQVLLRTAHMVWGVVTLMTAVVYTVRVFRVSAASSQPSRPVAELRRSALLVQSGGAQ